MIDYTRPWQVRMAAARRYHQHAMTADRRRPPHYAELRQAAARSVPNGWTLAPDLTRADVLADYRRVVRRNNPPTLARLFAKEAEIRGGVQ